MTRGVRVLLLGLTAALIGGAPAAADPPTAASVSPAPSLSQEPAVLGVDLMELVDREAELKAWMRVFTSWEDWAERWRNTQDDTAWSSSTPQTRSPK